MAVAGFNVAAVVARLRTEAPALAQVSGAADLALAMASGLRLTPAAFVLPLGERSSPNQWAAPAVQQAVEVSFAVVLAVRDLHDAQAVKAYDEGLGEARAAVFQALLGVALATESTAITHDSGALMQVKNATLWWKDTFMTTFYRRSR